MRNPLQLVLDFLSPPRETAQSSFDKTPKTPTSATPPKLGASRTTARPSDPLQLPDDVSIAHPRANRETVLEGMRVAYLFQRVRRRSIGFVVGPDGLEVRAPKWVTLKEVELGLQERGEWHRDLLRHGVQYQGQLSLEVQDLPAMNLVCRA
jgi:hypothetical protein